MNNGNTIIPFNDYWIDCEFNSVFSIITSIDNSFRDYACLNNYSYRINQDITPCGTEVRFIKLDNSDFMHSSYVTNAINKIPIKFKDSISMLDDVICLLENNLLLVGVDLYNWVPKSICWEKYHWEHFSLVLGYNPNENIFSVLDENLSGYGQHNITSERFVEAVQKAGLIEDGYIIHYKTNLERYQLCLDEVVNHAERIKLELTSLLNQEIIWNLTSQDIEEGHMLDLFSMYAYQISNRHIANQRLIESLLKLNYINKEQYTVMQRNFYELKRGWESIKNMFIWAYELMPRRINISKINDRKKQLLELEIHTWDYIQLKKPLPNKCIEQ